MRANNIHKKKQKVKPPPEYPPLLYKEGEKMLPMGTSVRVALDNPVTLSGEKLSGRFRAGDIRWELKPRTVENILMRPNQPIYYIVSGITSTVYTRDKLQVVKETEVKPKQTKWIVEKIVGKKKQGRTIYYRVKWQGYDSSQDTWEPRENLMEDVPAMVQEYEDSHR